MRDEPADAGRGTDADENGSDHTGAVHAGAAGEESAILAAPLRRFGAFDRECVGALPR